MMPERLRIATRKSPLALWQAEHVAACLRQAHADLNVELMTFTTQGDLLLDQPLAKIGGKGLFVKELERALLDHEADIAVHSMKDMPAELPQGLCLAAVMARELPFDALVANRYTDLDSLPQGARIGTCSLRRQAQLLARRPDLRIENLRGNLGTRLQKLDQGEFDAIVLAAAGLQRLGLTERITQVLPPEWCLPAAGQGIMGIETRDHDPRLKHLLAPLADQEADACITAERSLNAALGGSCQMPLGAYAELQADTLYLRGLLAAPDGSRIVSDAIHGPKTQAETLGKTLARRLLAAGGQEILQLLGVQARV